MDAGLDLYCRGSGHYVIPATALLAASNWLERVVLR